MLPPLGINGNTISTSRTCAVERIGAGFVESAVNQVMSKRMAEKQQMQWRMKIGWRNLYHFRMIRRRTTWRRSVYMSEWKKSLAILPFWWLALLLSLAIKGWAERLPIKTYTTAEGLARDQINRIVRDSQGFLWFCTGEGLSRFDSYRFINYNVDDGLPGRHVTDLLETRKGVYWVATNAGVARFITDPAPHRVSHPQSKFIPHLLRDDSDVVHVIALYEDRAGVVWCATNKGLYRLEQIRGQWRSSSVRLQHSNNCDDCVSVREFAEDNQGALWIITSIGLYRRFPDGRTERFAEREGLAAGDLSTLIVDDEGRIWVGTGHGLRRLVTDPQPHRNIVAQVYTTNDGLANNFITTLFRSSYGRLWVGTAKGLSEFLPSGKVRSFRSYTASNGLSDELITVIAEDNNGNLWLGSESGGAMKIAANGFTTYTESDGLGGHRIAAIFENQAGELCLFSSSVQKESITRFDGSRFKAVKLNLPKGISSWGWGWYQVIFQDHTGEWWMNTGEGLVRYPRTARLEQLTHATPKAVYTRRNGLPANEIFRVFEDSRGDIWISTFGHPTEMLTRWDRATEKFHSYSLADGLPNNMATAFREDASGNLWIGFYSYGLGRYASGRFKIFTTADGLPKGFIRGLYLDRAKRLWVATSEGGVARMDDPAADRPKFVIYTTAQGLSSNQVTCVTEDQWGRIYLGTGRGVDRLDPATGQIKRYTMADGLAGNFINVSFRDRNGALWFGALRGLSRLIPEPDRQTIPPPIRIGGIRIAGVKYVVPELGITEIKIPELAPNQNNLDIDYFNLNFRPGEIVRYQYKIEGADNNWSQMKDESSASLPNLAPGSYRFHVRAINTNGAISPTPATVTFTIMAPVWQRWWFIAIATLLIGMGLYQLYRYRVARLLEIERVRTRIATDLHDDIGSSLSQIAILSEVARRQVAQGDSSATEQLSLIAHISREAVDGMSDIVWAINPQRDCLSDLTGRMRRFAGEICPGRNIDFYFQASFPNQDLRLGADVRRQTYLIFKECLNNLVRHSACTRADFELYVETDWLIMKLTDNGRGVDSTTANGGHGLANMRRRAASLGGAIRIDSVLGRGTTITLKIPYSQRGRMAPPQRRPEVEAENISANRTAEDTYMNK